jgi:hypothetical protein
MANASDKFKYKQQEKHFYKLQNQKIDDFLREAYMVNVQLGEEGLINHLIKHFVDLERNTFFRKLESLDKSHFMIKPIKHFCDYFGYGQTFIERVLYGFLENIKSTDEADILNEDIIEVMKNKKTEPTAEPSKPKGLRV